MKLPKEVARAINDFSRFHKDVPTWRQFPNIDAEIDDELPMCDAMSRDFAVALEAAGVEAVSIIVAWDAPNPLTDIHVWTRIGRGPRAVNVDWTARQYANLEYPPNPAHANLPVPMIWEGRGSEHPLVTFRKQQTAEQLSPGQPHASFALGLHVYSQIDVIDRGAAKYDTAADLEL